MVTQVADTLEWKKVFSSPYYPQGNGCIEKLHNFLKACIWEYVSPEFAWDEVVPIACAAYNFVQNVHSNGSTFFLMFGWDAYTSLVQLLNLKLRYNGTSSYLERQESKFLTYPVPEHLVSDKVLVRNYTRDMWDPKYDVAYHVITDRRTTGISRCKW